VIQLRGRMGGILNLLNGMFGGGGNIVEKADVAVEKLQGYKERMVSRALLCFWCARACLMVAFVGGVGVVRRIPFSLLRVRALSLATERRVPRQWRRRYLTHAEQILGAVEQTVPFGRG